MLKEGEIAPDFTARANTGETIRLGDFRGKSSVVLSFYPRNFTSGCTAQACSYRDRYDRVHALNAVLIGVSYDDSDSHNRFAAAYGLPYPLISDTDRRLSRLYGAARLGGKFPLARRVTYVIDPDGVIRKVAHHELRVENHLRDILAALEQIGRERG